MARVEGYACGDITTGSGFVAAPQYVVTNAHVVAGVRDPILLVQGKRYASKVVLFDPNEDFAVLRTNTALPVVALALSSEKAVRGTSTAVLGFPGGGALRVSPGIVLRSQLAIGRDIYDRGLISREIYALQAKIEPGNSGGPVVLPDGRVAGVIFGEAVSRDGAGYALTSLEIADSLKAALTRSTAVSSGTCLEKQG
jgi:S1-C subfamily serine protease